MTSLRRQPRVSARPSTAAARPRSVLHHSRHLLACGVLLSLLLTPVAAGAQAAWSVQASTGWLNFGPLVQESQSYVRLGNMGNDVYFGLSVERSSGGAGALYASFISAPTTVSVWPRQAGEGKLNRFSYRPIPGTSELTTERDRIAGAQLRSGTVNWSCLSAGLSRKSGVLRLAAGATACRLSGLDPDLWGERGLRVAPGGEAEVGVRVPVTPALHVSTTCAAAALVNHRGFVRMQEAGAVPGDAPMSSAAVELPRAEPRRFALPLRCGLGAGVRL